MRVRNTPTLAAAGDGRWIGRRYIRPHGIDTFATCPMMYQFSRAHHIGVRVVLVDGKMSRWIHSVRDTAKQPELVTHGVWQQRESPYKMVRGVEHSREFNR
jgi:hypothetical protein